MSYSEELAKAEARIKDLEFRLNHVKESYQNALSLLEESSKLSIDKFEEWIKESPQDAYIDTMILIEIKNFKEHVLKGGEG